MIIFFYLSGFSKYIFMQILGLEYKYLAVWICKYTEEDFTQKRLIQNSCVFRNFLSVLFW